MTAFMRGMRTPVSTVWMPCGVRKPGCGLWSELSPLHLCCSPVLLLRPSSISRRRRADLIEVAGRSRVMWWLRWSTVSCAMGTVWGTGRSTGVATGLFPHDALPRLQQRLRWSAEWADFTALQAEIAIIRMVKSVPQVSDARANTAIGCSLDARR